jgi:hypothetical protein
MPAAFYSGYSAGSGELSPIDFRVGGKMGQGKHTAKRYSKIEDQDLAERMFELRKLRELVRNAETKSRVGRSTTQLASQCSFNDQG